MFVRANQLFKCPPRITAHKFSCKILIAVSDSLQNFAHLCFHYNVEAIQTIKIKKDMEVWHRLKKSQSSTSISFNITKAYRQKIARRVLLHVLMKRREVLQVLVNHRSVLNRESMLSGRKREKRRNWRRSRNIHKQIFHWQRTSHFLDFISILILVL